jgi:hypothetical protein
VDRPDRDDRASCADGRVPARRRFPDLGGSRLQSARRRRSRRGPRQAGSSLPWPARSGRRRRRADRVRALLAEDARYRRILAGADVPPEVANPSGCRSASKRVSGGLVQRQAPRPRNAQEGPAFSLATECANPMGWFLGFLRDRDRHAFVGSSS